MSNLPDRRGPRVFNLYNLFSVGVLLAMLVLGVAAPYPIEALRLGIFDLYQRAAPRETPTASAATVIVAVDDASLKEFGQMPWPRGVFARLTERLRAADPAVIVFDAIFAEPDRTGPAEDALFADAIRKVPVVLAQAGYWQKTIGDDRAPLVERISHEGSDPRAFAPQLKSMIRNIPALEQPAAGHGLILLATDVDSITRRMPTVFAFQGRLHPSLALEALRVAFRKDTVLAHGAENGIRAVTIREGLWVPTDRYGRIWPRFSKSDSGRHVSARAVLAGEVGESRIKDKIVLVGVTALALGDIKTTPLGTAVPGVEVHAQTIDAVLSGNVLERPRYADAAELTLALLAGLMLIISVPLLPARWSLVGFLAVIGGVTALSWFMFAVGRFLLDPGYPVITAFALYLVGLIGRNAQLERLHREKRCG